MYVHVHLCVHVCSCTSRDQKTGLGIISRCKSQAFTCPPPQCDTVSRRHVCLFFPMWVLRIKHWFEDQKIPDWAVSPALEHTFFSTESLCYQSFSTTELKKKILYNGAGEMAWSLRVFDVFQRAHVWFQAPTWQSPVTGVPSDPMPTSGICDHQECKWCTCIQRGKTCIEVKFNKTKKEKNTILYNIIWHECTTSYSTNPLLLDTAVLSCFSLLINDMFPFTYC